MHQTPRIPPGRSESCNLTAHSGDMIYSKEGIYLFAVRVRDHRPSLEESTRPDNLALFLIERGERIVTASPCFSIVPSIPRAQSLAKYAPSSGAAKATWRNRRPGSKAREPRKRAKDAGVSERT